jgi:hypothetical protein
VSQQSASLRTLFRARPVPQSEIAGGRGSRAQRDCYVKEEESRLHTSCPKPERPVFGQLEVKLPLKFALG